MNEEKSASISGGVDVFTNAHQKIELDTIVFFRCIMASKDNYES